MLLPATHTGLVSQAVSVIGVSQGESRAGWPVQMGEVQGQVLVADLNADGSLEIFSGEGISLQPSSEQLQPQQGHNLGTGPSQLLS